MPVSLRLFQAERKASLQLLSNPNCIAPGLPINLTLCPKLQFSCSGLTSSKAPFTI